MALYVLAALIGVPLIEIALFVEVGSRIGTWPTVGAVVLTALLGTALLRIQGLGVVRRIQDAMARGEVPVGPAIDGIGLLVAGLVLLTPGFLTDAIGFLLFIPAVRQFIGGWIGRRLIIKHGRNRGPRHPGGPADIDLKARPIDPDDITGRPPPATDPTVLPTGSSRWGRGPRGPRGPTGQ